MATKRSSSFRVFRRCSTQQKLIHPKNACIGFKRQRRAFSRNGGLNAVKNASKKTCCMRANNFVFLRLPQNVYLSWSHKSCRGGWPKRALNAFSSIGASVSIALSKNVGIAVIFSMLVKSHLCSDSSLRHFHWGQRRWSLGKHNPMEMCVEDIGNLHGNLVTTNIGGAMTMKTYTTIWISKLQMWLPPWGQNVQRIIGPSCEAKRVDRARSSVTTTFLIIFCQPQEYIR